MIFFAPGSSSIVSPGLRLLGDTPPPPIHTPEKSGVPFASRGAGPAGLAAGFGAWAAAGACAARHRIAAPAIEFVSQFLIA
jgi:hypothetical protein